MARYKTDAVVMVFVLFEITQLCSCASLTVGCIEQERQALLKFRHSFQNCTLQYPLSSWEGDECCKWKGIQCDGTTGHVVNIDLGIKCYPRVNVQVNDTSYIYVNTSCIYYIQKAVQGVSPSLMELKHLNYLDLSSCTFPGNPVPSFLGSLIQLRHLNLSNSQFNGSVPHDLGNLTNLEVLDLSSTSSLYDNYLYVDDFIWVSKLASLQYIDMSGVYMKGVSNLMQVICKLPQLLQVHLMYCGIDSLEIPHGFVNYTFLSKIQVLNLRGNLLSGPIPDALQNMTSMKNDLQALDLSHNQFNDHITNLGGQIKNLMYLNLGSNLFYGSFPQFLMNLTNLRELILEKNQLHGMIPTFLGRLLCMRVLDLSDNHFNGTIPTSLGRLSSLRVLDLSSNHFNGIIPDSLGNLLNLHILDLSNNSLEGTIHEIHLGNLSRLQDLRIGLNKLAVNLKPNWSPPFQLANLQLQSCEIETPFPQWLQTQKKLVTLDLSNTGISGTIPKWFHQMDLIKLDLSNNKISGLLPENLDEMMPNLNGLFLGNNLIIGSIPTSLCKLQGLINLDLSRNKLSKKIPNCLGIIYSMILIDLSSNTLSGTIPESLCDYESSLQSLNLSNNSLHGELPLVLGYCSFLEILDLGDNQLSGVIPSWIGENYFSLQILRLRKNMFDGSIPSSICQLSKLQILDLASNNFIGPIPHCIGNLQGMIHEHSLVVEFLAPAPAPGPSIGIAMAPEFDQWDKEDVKQVIKGRELDYTKTLKFVVNLDLSNNSLTGFIPEILTSLSGLVNLNLSHNYLSGKIPSKIGRMMSLESMDFSNNHLFGPIPNSMSTLTSLSHLNLSCNNFSGPIPTENQFLTLDDPSIYVGNPYLCGAPVLTKCHGNDTHQTPTSTGYEDNQGNKEEKEKVLFYFVIALGYITGFWGVIGILVFKRSWRHAYFRYVEKVGDKMYVAIAIRVARHKKRNGEKPH